MADFNVRLYLTHAFFLWLKCLHEFIQMHTSFTLFRHYVWVLIAVHFLNEYVWEFCLPYCFTVWASFSAVCLFFLCLMELGGPAHWHDNSLKMLWSLMHICSFHFIGVILFLYQINLLLTIFTCIITLKRNQDIFFLCCLSLENLMGRSWLLFPLTVLRNESIYTEN